LIVCDRWAAEQVAVPSECNKASIVFTIKHEEGSLSQILSVLSIYKGNLTKIQSMPILGHEWEYLFFVDLTYVNYLKFNQSLAAIRPLTKNLKILGEYQMAHQQV
jgi:prephenate dehydratase